MDHQYEFGSELFEADPEVGQDEATDGLTEWGAEGEGYLDPEEEGGWLGEVGGAPRGPFGVLTVAAPERLQYRYPFTADDVLWTARFLVGEAGGRDDPDNRAVIWAMFNRYALFTRQHYRTFHNF